MKNKRKLKILLFAQKFITIFIQSRNLAFKIRNTCEARLFMLEQNIFV